MGQAIVAFAIAIAALLAALALALDVGYALTQRRVEQNQADAAALAVGRQLATSVVLLNGRIAFATRQEEARCVAETYADANRAFDPSGAVRTIDLQFGDASSPTVWTVAAAATCPPAGALTPIPASTIYVRALVTETYPTLLARLIGQDRATVSASARVRLSGTGVPEDGPVWPMVRHYDPGDYDISLACSPTDCDPTTAPPMTFWSPNATDVVYGNFKGLVDFSRFSTRSWPTLAPQLETAWDQSGSLAATPATAPKVDRSGNCSGGWDTAGNDAPSQQDKQCSIPNWYFYAFQGRLSLASVWAGSSLPAGQEPPSAIGARPSVCGAATIPDPAPSCADPEVGDWIETAYGNVGQNMSDNMRARIRKEGRTTPFSGSIVATGPNKGNVYGQALTILVYLWDCAESYTSSAAPGSRWDLITSRGQPECARLQASGSSPTPDRVHLFTVAPFTFYEGLVTTQAIEGYWGGSFGDARSCQTCALNPLANTTFLVPDD